MQRDPLDARSQSALSEYYLQRVRDTGNEDYLPLAVSAAQAALEAVPASRNFGGLTALAHAEFSNHAFAAAREQAQHLIALDPSKGEPFAILGDAALELGDYAAATAAFAKMQSLEPANPGTETRLARLATVRGQPAEARRHLAQALNLLRALAHPPNETIAWCYWQLGETDFSEGDYQAAAQREQQALEISPGNFGALGSMGKVRAALGDFPSAISSYEQAARIAPAIEYMASLGDLYHLVGREQDAAVRYDLVEQLGAHSRIIHDSPYDRRVALFLADHNLKSEEAYTLARGEFDSGRHDVYGADALAWAALKAGRIAEARTAAQQALKLGTRDAKFFYHAGMVAQAARDSDLARKYLEQALALSPAFDPVQSAVARKTLQELAP